MSSSLPEYPPGPRGAGALLTLPLMAGDFMRFFEDMARWYGPIVRIPVGRERVVLITEPALIREVLVERARELEKDRVTRSLSRVLGEGLLTSEGTVWLRSRRKVAPSFQRGELAGYAAVMARRAADWAATAGERGALDLQAELGALTLGIVAETLFGAAHVGHVEEIAEALEGLMGVFQQRQRTWRRLLPEAALPWSRQIVDQHRQTIDRALDGILDRPEGTAQRRDLLARLQEARDEDGEGFTPQQLRDEAITLFLAGHETTALGLTYALLLLSQHPAARARLQAEVRAALPPDGPLPGMADVAGLPWLQAVIREVLRLYPPAWIIGRTSPAGMTLGGYRIDAGDALLTSQWLVQRSPRFYEAPLAFRPERWLDGTLERQLPQCAYVPFGGGPRVCVGNHFALMELGVLLAVIAQRLDWAVEAPSPLPLRPSVTLRPGAPITATFTRSGAAP